MSDPDLPPDWPPHRPEVRPWKQRTVRGPRADRVLDQVTVALPPMISELDYRPDRSLSAMVTASAGNLSHLDLVHGRTLMALNPLLLRSESISSSKIENLEAALTDYGRALLGVGANASAVSMAAATRAMDRMIADADTNREIRTPALLEAHHELFRRDPDELPRAGKVRTVQNWIGGSDYAPSNALYVPPPPETVAAYLEDLTAFANRTDLPALIQAAVVHAQFESIHPFIDGNGRIGRALIHAVLRHRRITRHLVVPIASGLVAHRDRYFEALHDYRAGHARTIIAMLATSTNIAASESWTTATNLVTLRHQWADRVGGTRPGTTQHRVLDLLTEEPIVNAGVLANRFALSESEARSVIDGLQGAGVLTRLGRTRRAPVWVAQDVLDEVADLNARIHAISVQLRSTQP